MIPDTKLEEKVLNTEIIDLNLSVRTYNYLMRAGVRTVGDYLNLDPNEKQKIAGKNKKIIPEADEKISHFLVEI
jgi:DNA-directed RNA polymerase subunit alpha